jgi:hypothetical protein
VVRINDLSVNHFLSDRTFIASFPANIQDTCGYFYWDDTGNSPVIQAEQIVLQINFLEIRFFIILAYPSG